MKKRDLKMLALLGLTSGLLISQGELAATENSTFAEQEFLSGLSTEDQQLYQNLDQEGQLLAKLIASPSCGNSCANEWNSRHGSGISYDGSCGGKSGCSGNSGADNYNNSGPRHHNYQGDSGTRGPGGVKGNSNRSNANQNNGNGNNRASNNNQNGGIRNGQVSLADEPNSYGAGAAPKSGANTRKQGLNDSGKIAGAGDQNRNGVSNHRNNNNNVNSNGNGNNNNNVNNNGNGNNNNNNNNNSNNNGYNNRHITLAANNNLNHNNTTNNNVNSNLNNNNLNNNNATNNNVNNNRNATRNNVNNNNVNNNRNNNNNNNNNNNGQISLSEETATTSQFQRPSGFTASGNATNSKGNTAGKNASNAGVKSNKGQNRNSAGFEQNPSKQHIDKNLLVSLLNKPGKAQYYRLSPEGQQLALELANQDCKGLNSCEGKNSCSSKLAQGPGLGGPGSSPGPFSDKNLAVRVAAMQEKRIALADN
ncbi:MAG: hypothetical protein Q8K75_09875 [Chlamydiales bacterium]|nr:hypothetical protein [Chlamydiales bacterium]